MPCVSLFLSLGAPRLAALEYKLTHDLTIDSLPCLCGITEHILGERHGNLRKPKQNASTICSNLLSRFGNWNTCSRFNIQKVQTGLLLKWNLTAYIDMIEGGKVRSPSSPLLTVVRMYRQASRPILRNTCAFCQQRPHSHAAVSFSPQGKTSASSSIPYGEPSQASSAYLPSKDETFRPPKAATEAPENLTARQKRILDRIIRVDQAGELGANWIYMGQLAVLKRTSDKRVVDLVQVCSLVPVIP